MKTKKLLSAIVVATVVLFAGCKKDTFEEIIGECPLVIETNPTNEAVDVPLNQVVLITFNKEMNPATITTESVTLYGPTTQVTGVVSYSGVNATFTPSDSLAINTIYIGRVKTSVKDLKGNALQVEYVWTFTTGSNIAPTVISTDPVNLESNVDLDKIITATFSEPMDPLTITGTSFTITESGNPVAGTVSYTQETQPHLHL
jgi:hypothetical protein